jgi:hypothetical protein
MAVVVVPRAVNVDRARSRNFEVKETGFRHSTGDQPDADQQASQQDHRLTSATAWTRD